MKRTLITVSLLLASVAVGAEDAPKDAPAATTAAANEAAPKDKSSATTAATDPESAPAKTGAKAISGMSILGNQEAPKSLVIVPWKSSEIGESRNLATLLDDSRRPVDRDVFMRELSYYEVRSGTKPDAQAIQTGRGGD
jgi:hypothetical protein